MSLARRREPCDASRLPADGEGVYGTDGSGPPRVRHVNEEFSTFCFYPNGGSRDSCVRASVEPEVGGPGGVTRDGGVTEFLTCVPIGERLVVN